MSGIVTSAVLMCTAQIETGAAEAFWFFCLMGTFPCQETCERRDFPHTMVCIQTVIQSLLNQPNRPPGCFQPENYMFTEAVNNSLFDIELIKPHKAALVPIRELKYG